MTKIDIYNEREGVYWIVSLQSRDRMTITSQGLLELATWIEANKAILEEEAAKEGRKDHRFESQDTQKKGEWHNYRTSSGPDRDTT